AEKVRIDIEAKARAEGLRITTIAEATAESIRRVNEAIQAGGEPYFRYRQIEMLPQIVPAIAQRLADAKLVTIAAGSGAGVPDRRLRVKMKSIRWSNVDRAFSRSACWQQVRPRGSRRGSIHMSR